MPASVKQVKRLRVLKSNAPQPTERRNPAVSMSINDLTDVSVGNMQENQVLVKRGTIIVPGEANFPSTKLYVGILALSADVADVNDLKSRFDPAPVSPESADFQGLSIGAWVAFRANEATDTYNYPWIAFPSDLSVSNDSLHIVVQSGDSKGELDINWVDSGHTLVVDGVTYNIWVRNLAVDSGEAISFIVKNYQNARG